MRTPLAVVLGLVACVAAAASPAVEALQRPAIAVREPGRAVLLSAARAGERIVAVGERGVIALSDDGGASWRQVPCPVSVTLTMVRFADAMHGVAVGHGGAVLISTDGGSTWALRLDGRRIAALAATAARTPEALKDAERLRVDGPDKPFLDVLVWDAQRMLVVGAYGLAFRTDDGGTSWSPWMDRLPNPRGLHWYVARRAGDTVLLAGEQGLVLRSDDGGSNFRPLSSPYKGSWFAGDLLPDRSVLLAGLRGNVWRLPDASAQWTQIASPVPASINAMTTTANGQLLLATQAGIVLRLQGDMLAPLNADTPLPMPSALLADRAGSLLSFGIAGARPLAPAPQPSGTPR
jgi:photosystem II stability/assembly factor-like uncharacterized protein